MKIYFIKRLFFFLAPILLLGFIFELAVRQISNPYKYKYYWMQHHAKEVETLVFGNSHTFYGVRPEFLKGMAFNLANPSQGKEQDLFLLKYWAGQYEKLKTVIVPVSYGSWFSRGLENSIESYRCRYYKIYMDCNLYSDWSKNNFELSDIRSAVAKLSKLGGAEFSEFDEYGWGKTNILEKKNHHTWNDESEAVKTLNRHKAKNMDYVSKNYRLLSEFADFCRSHQIIMVLITTPCWHSYYSRLDSAQYYKMHELTKQLQEEYQLPYFDYMRDPRFDADDFYDSNHLSEYGAEKFTKILNEDINQKLN